MKVLAMVRSNASTEAGEMPSEAMLTAMVRYNEEMVQAGVMLAGEGLKPSSAGARVTFNGERRTVTDGPFAEAKELVAGYWLLNVKSLAEAIDWIKRCPNPTAGESVIELRPLFEADDFGAEFTPEARAQEERQRAAMEARR